MLFKMVPFCQHFFLFASTFNNPDFVNHIDKQNFNHKSQQINCLSRLKSTTTD
ncbi:hypothetical protein Hanom_Chr04g00345311 [Helianthus anomalus]